VLGFDFGAHRIGVAVGQTHSRTASALTTLRARHGTPDWEAVRQLLDEWRPDALVVGVPLHMDGTPHEITQQARRFMRRLEGRFHLPVYAAEERLTSVDAESRLKARGGDFADADIDREAARLLLQDWLQNNKTEYNNTVHVHEPDRR
jgi:putative Holliday junction resolvase